MACKIFSSRNFNKSCEIYFIEKDLKITSHYFKSLIWQFYNKVKKLFFLSMQWFLHRNLYLMLSLWIFIAVNIQALNSRSIFRYFIFLFWEMNKFKSLLYNWLFKIQTTWLIKLFLWDFEIEFICWMIDYKNMTNVFGYSACSICFC